MRITSTHIDAYYQYLRGYIDLPTLVNKIQGKQETTHWMQYGHILHRILEDDNLYRMATSGETVKIDNILVEAELADKLALFDRSGIPEYKKEYQWGHHTLVGVTDRYNDDYLLEYKFIFNPREDIFSSFYGSYQWRFYLFLFKVPRIKYEILYLPDGSFWSFEFWWYNNLIADVENLCNEFVNFGSKYL